MQLPIGAKVVRKSEANHPQRRIGIVIDYLEDDRLLVSWQGNAEEIARCPAGNYARPKKTKVKAIGLIAL